MPSESPRRLRERDVLLGLATALIAILSGGCFCGFVPFFVLFGEGWGGLLSLSPFTLGPPLTIAAGVAVLIELSRGRPACVSSAVIAALGLTWLLGTPSLWRGTQSDWLAPDVLAYGLAMCAGALTLRVGLTARRRELSEDAEGAKPDSTTPPP
jgi:hypothetical protein